MQPACTMCTFFAYPAATESRVNPQSAHPHRTRLRIGRPRTNTASAYQGVPRVTSVPSLAADTNSFAVKANACTCCATSSSNALNAQPRTTPNYVTTTKSMRAASATKNRDLAHGQSPPVYPSRPRPPRRVMYTSAHSLSSSSSSASSVRSPSTVSCSSPLFNVPYMAGLVPLFPDRHPDPESPGVDLSAQSRGELLDANTNSKSCSKSCKEPDLIQTEVLRPRCALPAIWRRALTLLADAGIRGEKMSALIERAGLPFVFALNTEIVKAVVRLLTVDLALNPQKAASVISRCPSLLLDDTRVRRSVELLRRLHFSNRDIHYTTYKWPSVLALDTESASAVLDYLCTPTVGFTIASIRPLLRRAPWILTYDVEKEMAPAVNALRHCFLFRKSDVTASETSACPSLTSTAQAERDDLIASEVVGSDDNDVESAIPCNAIEEMYERKANTRVETIIDVHAQSTSSVLPAQSDHDTSNPPFAQNGKDVLQNSEAASNSDAASTRAQNKPPPLLTIEHVIRACPNILCTPPEKVELVLQFLRDSLAMSEATILSIVRQFPAILVSSVDMTLRPTANYLMEELSLSIYDILRIVRAFPAVLCLDVATEIEPNVRFFREHGVENVSRVIARLPPVLSYDIASNLAPKMEFLKKGLGLSAYDVLLFPGYFSYSLTECIEPRTRFLQKLGVPLTAFGLNMILATTDDVFCARVAQASLESYISFRRALSDRRERLNEQLAAESDPEASADPVSAYFRADTPETARPFQPGEAQDLEAPVSDGKNSNPKDFESASETASERNGASVLPKALVPILPPRPRRRRRKSINSLNVTQTMMPGHHMTSDGSEV